MADTLITNLTNVTSPNGTEEIAVNIPGSPDTDGKVTLANAAAYANNLIGPVVGAATVITTLGDTDQLPAVQSNVLKSITYAALKTLLGVLYQAKATILGTLGVLSNSAGYLKNDGAGVLSWATPSGGGGKVAQVVTATSNTRTTTTAAMYYDDTIPQNTEGAEYITLAITPTNASSKLIIRFDAMCDADTVRYVMAALFVDSTADAISATAVTVGNASNNNQMTVSAVITAGSTAARTYKIRYGMQAGTGVMNGSYGSGHIFGAAALATFTIMEVLP